MRSQMRIGRWGLALGASAAFPALVALLVIAGSPGLPLGLLVGLAAVATTLVVASVAFSQARDTSPARTETVRFELRNTVPLRVGPASVTAVGMEGACPLGFSVGTTWTIDGAGGISPSLCKPAVAAVGLLFQPAGQALAETQCVCPLKGRGLTFSRRVASPVG